MAASQSECQSGIDYCGIDCYHCVMVVFLSGGRRFGGITNQELPLDK